MGSGWYYHTLESMERTGHMVSNRIGAGHLFGESTDWRDENGPSEGIRTVYV